MTDTTHLIGNGLIRNPPQQGRSRATLERIEAAARQLLRDPEIGRDRFTTAQVARGADVSIGTLYRYFDDRTAILEHVWPERQDAAMPPE
ncbi:TetR/AcrR family transcriptional regulator [Lacisediminihabitans sp. H27-G8]|uniref:TetR/AcrR family transcriptional regulator n=1 Tax=Lacisediminihabitans sp. H27-G8 TaxID=3111909 RepID=UPI0038FC1B40